jgi:hypothetical protein
MKGRATPKMANLRGPSKIREWTCPVTAAKIVKALDEREHRHPRLGLRLEPVPVEKLAFERGEEALAHRIVVGVSDRAHRGAYAGFPAAVSERDRGVLGGFKWSSQHVDERGLR